MADDSSPKPKAEAVSEASDPKSPEEEDQAPDQGSSEGPGDEAPSAAEAKPEAESDLESTTATEHEGTEEAAEASSTVTSASTATEEVPQSKPKKTTTIAATSQQSITAVKERSTRTLAEQNRSVERLSRPSVKKSQAADGKKKSKSILFDKTAETKETEEPEAAEDEEAVEEEEPSKDEAIPPPAEETSAAEVGPPKGEVEEKLPKRRSKTGTPKISPAPSHEGKPRTSVTSHAKRATVIKSKGDFEGKPRFQNTYRLDSKKPFSVDRVYSIIKMTVDKALQDVRYHPDECAKLVASMSNEIKTKIKLQGYDRYKIAVQVIIGEKKQQSVYSIMRFLWDVERDHYSIYSYENTTLFAIALALGVYYE